ncbi:hypothetical protein BG003_011617 [Podila horticola]|nr:hypothetical protein BG003_011617 [Podila horticola]
MADNSYAAVNHTRPALQFILTGGPVTEWSIEKAGEKGYKFSVGGYRYVGVLEGEAMASIHSEQGEEWLVEHRELQNAYTISRASEPHLGWTKSQEPESSKVDISPIMAMLSDPPRFIPSQLWVFEPIHE